MSQDLVHESASTSRDDRIAAILLAAGESRRMGQPKALIRYNGKTFVQQISERLSLAGLAEIIVVLGHQAETVRPACPPFVRSVVNPFPTLGQFSSLQSGVRALAADVSAVLVCLVDQPHLPVELILSLVRARQPQKIIVPSFAGRQGHPVLYDRCFFPHLLARAPIQTAHDLQQRFAENIQRLEWPQESILWDADTPDDLARIFSHW